MTNSLAGVVRVLLAERRAVAEKERQLIDTLNRLLVPSGYRAVPFHDGRGGGQGPGTGKRPRTTGKFHACPQCSRLFALQMHLGRHMKAAHGKAKAVMEKKLVEKEPAAKRTKKH